MTHQKAYPQLGHQQTTDQQHSNPALEQIVDNFTREANVKTVKTHKHKAHNEVTATQPTPRYGSLYVTLCFVLRLNIETESERVGLGGDLRVKTNGTRLVFP